MELVFLVVVVVVVFVVAAAAVGHGDGLEPARAEPDVPRLPGDRVEPRDLDDLTLTVAVRGYRMDQVDEVLDRLRDELARRDERIVGLERALRTATGGADRPQTRPDAPGGGGRDGH